MKAKRKVRRAARRLFRFCLRDGVLDEGRVREVVRRLGGLKSRSTLPVLMDLRRLVRLDRSRYTALVESATPIPDALRDTIRADLARAYGPTLTTSFRENPALIGGLRIKVASDVYDGSVRARLSALAARW